MSQNQKKLLDDKRVVEEINRHLWIESEKAGTDIGFETAAEDWLKRFSKAWMDYHMPNQKKTATRSAKSFKTEEKTPKRSRTKSV